MLSRVTFGLFIAMMCAQSWAQTPTDSSPSPQSSTPAAQQPAATPAAGPAAPTALPTPSITGPLANLPLAAFDAGPFGNIAVNGILSGSGLWQGNHIPGDNTVQAAVSNAQVFIQKTDGWFQFYLEAGAYTLPALATPYLGTGDTLTDFFGALPVAYVKLAPAKNTSVLIGALPTVIGAEYTFTFENMNVERGLLWNQENAVNRGIQVNQTLGKLTAAVSWNDGFYSDRYTWVTGSLTYANGPHSLIFAAGGNFGRTAFQNLRTPAQNNGSLYNVIYTYTKGPWIVQPYFQYTDVPTNQAIGITKGAGTRSGAILVSHAFKDGFSLAGRFEYITSTGSAANQSVNLLFGPGSAGASYTLTPTYQRGGFFVRGDLSWVHANSYTPGFAFGPNGSNADQPRAMAEIGFLFGNNIQKKP